MDPDGIDQGNKLRTVAHALRQSMRHDDLLGPVDRRLRVVALDEAVLGQEPRLSCAAPWDRALLRAGEGPAPSACGSPPCVSPPLYAGKRTLKNATETKAPQSRSKPRVQGVIAGLLTIQYFTLGKRPSSPNPASLKNVRELLSRMDIARAHAQVLCLAYKGQGWKSQVSFCAPR